MKKNMEHVSGKQEQALKELRQFHEPGISTITELIGIIPVEEKQCDLDAFRDNQLRSETYDTLLKDFDVVNDRFFTFKVDNHDTLHKLLQNQHGVHVFVRADLRR